MSLGFFGDTCLKIFLEQVVGLLHIPLLRMKVFALLWHESELPCSPRMALLLQFALCLLQPFVVLLVGHVFFWVWILGAVREAWSVGPMSCRHVGKQIFPSLGCLHCVSWSWQDWTCPIGASFHGYCCWHNCSAAPSYCLDIQCFSVLERRLPWLEQERLRMVTQLCHSPCGFLHSLPRCYCKNRQIFPYDAAVLQCVSQGLTSEVLVEGRRPAR